MSNYKGSLLTLIIIFSLQSSFSFSQGNNFVYVKGDKVFAPDGKELLLKGINVGNWLEPEGYMFSFKNAESSRKIYEVFNEIIGPDAAANFWNDFRNNYMTANDIKFIKENGFNSIRIPFDYKILTGEDFSAAKANNGIKLLDDIIHWCSNNKIYAILDMHCAPGGQTGANIDDSWGYPYLYENVESQNLTIKIWKDLADRYKDEPYILGYDLLNEPIAPYFNSDKLNPMLEPLYIKITNAIRTVDIFGKPFDSKLIYTFHKYWSDTSQSVIQEYIDFRNKYNVPIWLGESGENTMEWITSFKNLLEKNDIGWCFWTYKRLETDRSIVSINRPDGYDKIINYANSNRQTFDDIRKSLPDKDTITKTISEYLHNIKLENCKINKEYIKALGLE
jgi:aryl-phospho-beta-D-glucosidase BglC (GH1 family)